MKIYGAGNAILYFRLKNNLSQLQVCEGICPEMTLSRIETGEREFDSLISETLMSRVGKTPARFEFVLNKEDYDLYKLREDIKNHIHQENLGKAQRCLKEYENIIPENQPLHRQFLLYHLAMVQKRKQRPSEEITALLHQAIDITRPNYKEKPKLMMLFSRIEVKIIYQLFLYENYSEDTLYSLLRFMNRIYDDEEKEQLMVPFLHKIMRQQEEQNSFREVDRTCTRAIEIIRAGRTYRYLTDFYFSRIKARERMWHGGAEWKQRREELAEACMNVYYMSMTEENEQRMKEVEVFCREKLQWQITMQEI